MTSFEIDSKVQEVSDKITAAKTRLTSQKASVVGTAAALAAIQGDYASLLAEIRALPGDEGDNYAGASPWEANVQDKIEKMLADYAPLRDDAQTFSTEAQAHTEF